MKSKTNNLNYKIIKLRSIDNGSNGMLSFFENNIDYNFEIKRFYYIYGASAGSERGFHAHKKLKQLLFCPHGKIEVTLMNENEKTIIILDEPNKGLIIEPCTWREIKWIQQNAVLCVAVSDFYDESDYIRDFEEYLEYLGGLSNENTG